MKPVQDRARGHRDRPGAGFARLEFVSVRPLGPPFNRDRFTMRTLMPPLLALALLIAGAARAQPGPSVNTSDDDATEVAKKLQNPVGNLISVPFQSNTNLNVGPHKGTQEILN